MIVRTRVIAHERMGSHLPMDFDTVRMSEIRVGKMDLGLGPSVATAMLWATHHRPELVTALYRTWGVPDNHGS